MPVFRIQLSLVTMPEQEGERVWFQPFAHAPNRGEIPLLPHTIDTLPYIGDTNIDTMRYIVRRFTIAVSTGKETH